MNAAVSVVCVKGLSQMATDKARQLLVDRMYCDVICSFGTSRAFEFTFFCNVKVVEQRASAGKDCATERAHIELETQGFLSVRSVCPEQMANQRFVISELHGALGSLWIV